MTEFVDDSFDSLSVLTKLSTLDLSRSGIESKALIKILKSNPQLQELNVSQNVSQNFSCDEVSSTCSIYNRNIKSVDFWKSNNLTIIGIRSLASCTMLEKLDFGWCLREESNVTESLKMLLQNCPNLKKLILAAARYCFKKLET